MFSELEMMFCHKGLSSLTTFCPKCEKSSNIKSAKRPVIFGNHFKKAVKFKEIFRQYKYTTNQILFRN